MSEVVSFAGLLGGLFVVATLLLGLDQWKWPQSPSSRSLLAAILVTFELIAALWLGHRFLPSSYELISTTLACMHFAFLCFWCTCSRAPTGLRLFLLLLMIGLLYLLAGLPPNLNPQEASNAIVGRAIHRLVVTTLGAFVCGACCRLRGWRFESSEQLQEASQTMLKATSIQALIAGVLISLVVFAVVGVQQFVESQWTDTFRDDFAVLTFACFVAGLMLAGLAVTACQFRFEWLGGIAVGVAIIWSVTNMSSRYQSWKVMQLRPELWRQYLPWLLLSTSWWWLLFKHLGGTGFMLVHSDRSILVRPGLKHALLAMVIVAALLSGVKSRYFDQFDNLVRMAMTQAMGQVEPQQGTFDAAAFGQSPITGLVFRTQMPERVVRAMPRLKSLDKIRFESCIPEQELIDRLSRLKQLRELSFIDCNLLQLNFNELVSGGPPIESLEMIHCPLKPEQIASIGKMTGLKRLAVSDRDLLESFGSLASLERLDLRSCRSLDLGKLLSLGLPNLKSLKLPSERGIVGWKGVPDATHFPQLDTLPIEVTEINEKVIEQLKAYQHLTTLDVINCRRGFDLLGELNLKVLRLHHCEVTPESFRQISENAPQEKLHVQGVIKGGALQEFVPLAVSAVEAKPNTFVQLTRLPVEETPPELASAQGLMISELSMIYEDDFHEEMIRLDRAGLTRLSGVELDFEQFLTVIRIGRSSFENMAVRNGDRMLIHPNDSGNLQFGSLPLREVTGQELRRIFESSLTINMLYLINPNLRADDWKALADNSNVGFAELHKFAGPIDLQAVLEAFHGEDRHPHLRVYLPDDVTKQEVEKMQSESGPRVHLMRKRERREESQY